jgi:hypothetical protein
VSGATVSILVTDQQKNTLTITFTVSTSSSTAQFIFVDSVHGNDTIGAGTIGSPWASYSKAFGASYSASVNAKALCYFRAGTYALPVYSDQDINLSNPLCELNTATKPSALMAFPGDAAPVFTLTNAQLATNVGGADLFIQGLNPNGAQAAPNNGRFIWVTGAGNNSARMTFDSIAWSNPTYGTGASNATGYFMDGNSSNLMPYTFINNCSESNRQSGFPGNNYIGCSFYGALNPLVQGCSINQPGLQADGAWYFKSDVKNGCLRGNLVIASQYTHACDFGQEVNADTLNGETCYNTLIGGGGIFLGFGSFPFGTLWCYRNSVSGTRALASNGPSSGGPYVFDSNAAQGITALPSGSSIQADGLNILQSSGLLDATTGNLTAAFAASLGEVGAQIA